MFVKRIDTVSLRNLRSRQHLLEALCDGCDLKFAMQGVADKPAAAGEMHGQTLNQTHALSWTNDFAAANAEGVLAHGKPDLRYGEHGSYPALDFRIGATFTVTPKGRVTNVAVAGYSSDGTVESVSTWGACKTEGGYLA